MNHPPVRSSRIPAAVSRACAPLLALLLAAPGAAGQWTPQLDLDAPASGFTWSGSTSLGPLVGNPSNAFQLNGAVSARLDPSGAQALGAGEFLGGDAFPVPDIAGQVPNPFPFLPPLATFTVTNLHVSLASDPFAIAPGGDFVALGTATALSGTLTMTPLAGSQTVQDLTGLSSDPTPQAGRFEHLAGNLRLTTSFTGTFPFDDPGTGLSGSITIDGSILARWSAPPPAVYCSAQQNSLGCLPAIAGVGTPSYEETLPFSIEASGLVNQKTGLLFYGHGAQATPFAGGTMCVSAPRVRTPPQLSGGSTSGADCSGGFAYDMNARIQSLADPALVPGAEVYAQYWSRDPQAIGTTTNLTDALSFTIAP